MIRITIRAAMAIASACRAHHLSEHGGLRIAPKATGGNSDPGPLVVDFVDGPAPWDTVVSEGDATVFLADGVEGLIDRRVLDVDTDTGAKPPRLVLRLPPVAREHRDR